MDISLYGKVVKSFCGTPMWRYARAIARIFSFPATINVSHYKSQGFTDKESRETAETQNKMPESVGCE